VRLFRWLAGAALSVNLVGASAEQPTPHVVRVQPSASEVPANLLRISVEFAGPPQGPVLPRLGLSDAKGGRVRQPFLQQALWSPSGKILTVMMHPGRVKTGLIAREQWGPILAAGDAVNLTLDGRPIKQWIVGPPDANGPDVSAWQLSPVHVGSKQALIVTLDAAIDGRAADYLAIADDHDRRVEGRAVLTRGESTWRFTPNVPWHAGPYKLIARSTLEDPAGNRLGGHFETPIDSQPGPAADAVLVFSAVSTSSSVERNRPLRTH
jgi:hypothetical protein